MRALTPLAAVLLVASGCASGDDATAIKPRADATDVPTPGASAAQAEAAAKGRAEAAAKSGR